MINSPPQVQTTRGHGLGMFVVYESPFQMVADSPDIYQNAAGFDFMKSAHDLGRNAIPRRRHR